MDPLEVANAFHREINAAKVAKPVTAVSERVNRIKYTRPGVPNKLGLGATDNARRAKLGIKTPNVGQVSKVLDTAVRKGLSLEGVTRSLAAGKKVETPAADAAKKGSNLFGPPKKKPANARRWA